jgi:hypothetical protein
MTEKDTRKDKISIEELLTHSKKTFIAKIGNTFLVSPMSEETAESMSSKEMEKCFVKFPDEIIKCLKNTPNVVKHSQKMDTETSGCFYIEEEEKDPERVIEVYEVSGLVPNFLDYSKFQVIWPSKNQDIPSWYSGKVVETFNIIYDGAIFLAFGESDSVGDSSYAWQFGLEAMKIIKSCFEGSESWKLTKIGPIMLHPAIYFVFLDNMVDLTLPTTRVRDNDLFVFFPYHNGISSEQAIENFFFSVAYDVKEHHGNLILRQEVMNAEIEFRKNFVSIGTVHQKLLNTSAWNPINIKKRYSYTRQLRDGIREAYQLYVDLMDIEASFVEARRNLQTTLLQNRFLKELADYFDSIVGDVGKDDFSPILQGLRFFEEETRMMAMTRSNLQAAIIGGFIGAAIYAIASLLLG